VFARFVAGKASWNRFLMREVVLGTKISEVMTARPRAVEPQTPVREAAQLMESEDVGSLPVVQDGARLVGVVTDRDIAVRVVARGLDPEATAVGDIASRELVTLTPDDDLDDALALMAREKVRRLPIVVREDELVGVVSQADVAQAAKEKSVGQVVEAISRAPHGPRVSGGTSVDDSSAERDERSDREQDERDVEDR
jgi:CBS domain-containing protein